MIETIFWRGMGSSLVDRALIGLALAVVISTVAHRAKSLTASGAVAAIVCGTVCAAAGWGWAALLVTYFASSTLISRVRMREKDALTGSVVAKGGKRDAFQVLANGGVYTAAAAAGIVSSNPFWVWGALGALAASAADSWATEIGVWLGGIPRSIISRTTVLVGQSGGVTSAGLAGAVAGAVLLAVAALFFGFPRGAALASVGSGLAGAMLDSLIGATLQDRRRCDSCGAFTERAMHTCGSPTRHVGGVRFVNNDVVNGLATFAGYCISVTLYFTIGGLTGRSIGG